MMTESLSPRLLDQLLRQLIRFGRGLLAEVVLADVGGGFVVDELLVLEQRQCVGVGGSRAAEYRGDRAAACLPLTHTQERPGGSHHRAAWRLSPLLHEYHTTPFATASWRRRERLLTSWPFFCDVLAV